MIAGLHRLIEDVDVFSRVLVPRQRLREYQRLPAQAILDSVIQRRGEQFAIVFSRQSGKDELLAQVVAMLLVRYSQRGGTVVIAAPTLRPQAALSRDRLRDRLLGHSLTASMMTVHDGGTIALGKARARFVSGKSVV